MHVNKIKKTKKNKIRNTLILYCIFVLCTQITVLGESNQLGNNYRIPAESGEEIEIFTDRSVYCVNEKLYFKVNYNCIDELKSFDWSNVLYVELIKWNGFKIIQLKMKLDRDGTCGYFEIPGNIVSGNYYLRAYTKWMRNFSVYDYGYNSIKIVNPFKSEVDNGPQNNNGEKNVEYTASKNGINGVICSATEKKYKTRQDVDVELSLNKEFSGCKNYCVSVVKEGLLDTTSFIIHTKNIHENQKKNTIEYLPEIRGMTISGKISGDKDIFSDDILISLAEPQNGEYYSVHHTKINDRFLFSLPDLQGDYEFYISADIEESLHAEILIDNDFCNNPVLLPYIPFQLTDDERDLVKEMMINVQLHDKFFKQAGEPENFDVTNTKTPAFYGKPKNNIYTKDYIELPNLKEFFYEIVTEINVKKRKNNYYLDHEGSRGSSEYPLLILMDNIPVGNNNELLKIPLNRIERVEVIDNLYVIGNTKFNGLINIYSIKKDFAGIELNKNSVFFNYQLYSGKNIEYPVTIKDKTDERIPDRRNLLYWQPDVEIDSDKKTKISFTTSDIKGDYILYVRGTRNSDDTEIYGKYCFSVE